MVTQKDIKKLEMKKIHDSKDDLSFFIDAVSTLDLKCMFRK